MRRVLLVIVILVFIIPYAQAISVLSGWFGIPGSITIGRTTLTVEDISIRDQSLLVSLNGSIHEGFVLPLGHEVVLNGLNITLNQVMVGSESYSHMEMHFPYLIEGESITFGDYRILLSSVSERGASLRLSYRNITKDIRYKGGTVSFENLRLSMKLMPVLFDGYLYRGDTQKIGEWNVTFDGYNVTKDGEKLIEIIRLKVNGKEYFSEIGQTLDTDGLQIEVKDLVGSEYLRIRAKLKGAYVSIRVLPYFDGWITEGKSTELGPYILRIEGISGNRAYVSVENSCGMPLKGGFTSIGNFTDMFSYGGLSIGALAVRNEKNEKQVRIIAMLDESKIPKIRDVAFLNVSFEIPEKIEEYVPFKARVIIQNTGKSDLRYVEIIPNISRDFEITGKYPDYIPIIKKGEKIEFPLVLRPLSSGNMTVGNIRVIAHASYALSCHGLENVSFFSETKRVEVPKAIFDYSIHVSSRDGRVGEPIPVNISVRNLGNSKLPFDLTVAVPEGFGVAARNFTLYGGWLHLRDSIAPNRTKIYRLSLIPSKEGKYKIIGVVSAGNRIFKDSEIITVSGIKKEVIQPPQNETSPQIQNATCKPKVVTQIIKVPVTQNSTVTVQSMTLKQKALYIGGSFVGGIVFILLLAWIAAKMEEKKG